METTNSDLMECLAKFKELSAMTIENPVFSDYVNCTDYIVLHVFLDRQYMAWDISDILLGRYSLYPLLARRDEDGSLTAIMYSTPNDSIMHIVSVNSDVNELSDGFDVMLFNSVDNIFNYISKVIRDGRNSKSDVLEIHDLSEVMVRFLN